MIILIAVSSALYLALGNHFWHQIVLSKWLQCANDSDHDVLPSCSIPDDHIDPRRSAFFMARSVLGDIREDAQC